MGVPTAFVLFYALAKLVKLAREVTDIPGR